MLSPIPLQWQPTELAGAFMMGGGESWGRIEGWCGCSRTGAAYRPGLGHQQSSPSLGPKLDHELCRGEHHPP